MRRKITSNAVTDSAKPRASDMATATMEPAKVLVNLSAQAPKRLHPVASRRHLTAKLFDALCADFEVHGPDAIRACRAEQPQGYLRLIASLLPNELDRNDNPLKDIPDDELAAIIEHLRGIVAGRGDAGRHGQGADPTPH